MPNGLHVIIATILGFISRELLNIPNEGKMKAILRAHSVLPLALLYENGRKLNPGNSSHLDVRYGVMFHDNVGNLVILLVGK
jgi:hypothetical protein